MRSTLVSLRPGRFLLGFFDSEVMANLLGETRTEHGRVIAPLDHGGLLELPLGRIDSDDDRVSLLGFAESQLRPGNRNVVFADADQASPAQDHEDGSPVFIEQQIFNLAEFFVLVVLGFDAPDLAGEQHVLDRFVFSR